MFICDNLQCNFSYYTNNNKFFQSNEKKNMLILKQSLSTTSNTDRQLLRQKFHQKISVMKTNTAVFLVFKTKR